MKICSKKRRTIQFNRKILNKSFNISSTGAKVLKKTSGIHRNNLTKIQEINKKNKVIQANHLSKQKKNHLFKGKNRKN